MYIITLLYMSKKYLYIPNHIQSHSQHSEYESSENGMRFFYNELINS